MSQLDPAYVKAWTEKAKGVTFMGVPLENLTHEELLAAAAHGWTAEAEARRTILERAPAICR